MFCLGLGFGSMYNEHRSVCGINESLCNSKFGQNSHWLSKLEVFEIETTENSKWHIYKWSQRFKPQIPY